jgi:hypothetical protein
MLTVNRALLAAATATGETDRRLDAHKILNRTEDVGLPGCDAVSLDEWFLRFGRIEVPPSSGVEGSKKVTQRQIPETPDSQQHRLDNPKCRPQAG